MGVWQQLSGHIATHAAAYVTLTIAAALLSVVVSIALFVKLRSIARPLARIRDGGEDAAGIIAGVAASMEEAERILDRLGSEFRAHVEASRACVRHVGIVRYDAFSEVGGAQSFSLCLLDADRNGIIVTCLAGRNFTRNYAVTMTGGKPSRELGEDEVRAMNHALGVETPVGV